MSQPEDRPPAKEDGPAVPTRTTISFGLTGAIAKRPGLAKTGGIAIGAPPQRTPPASTTDSDKALAATEESPPPPLIIPLPREASTGNGTPHERITMPRAWEAYDPHKIGLQVRRPLGGEEEEEEEDDDDDDVRDGRDAVKNPKDSHLVPFLKRLRSSDLEEDEVVSRVEPQAYGKIPVDQFGAALLRGMGWREGEAVGRRRRQGGGRSGEAQAQAQDVKIIEPRVRPRGLGLGATVGGGTRDKEQSGEGEADDELRRLVTSTDPSHSPNVSFDRAQSMVGVGSLVLIRRGAHAGEQGVVTRVLAEEAQVRLGSSETLLLVDPEHLQLISGGEGDHPEAAELGETESATWCWLCPHIRVQFVSRGSSRLAMYHGRQGDVLDVHQGLAIIRMPSGALVTDVPVSHLQPSRPAVGETVLVLTRGRHQGLRGVLLAVDGPTAHVQVLDVEEGEEDDPNLATGPRFDLAPASPSTSIVSVALDGIAPYCI